MRRNFRRVRLKKDRSQVVCRIVGVGVSRGLVNRDAEVAAGLRRVPSGEQE